MQINDRTQIKMNRELLNRLMTYEQMAEALSVNPGTLRNWVSQDFVPHVKIGRLVRFDPIAVEQWLKKRIHQGRLQMRADQT